MFKRLLLLLLVAFAACATPGPALKGGQLDSSSGSVEDLTAKTVALVVPRIDMRVRAYCSGVWVSSKAILTAHHCIEKKTGEVYYVTKDQVLDAEGEEKIGPKVGIAHIVAQDADHDLALLTAEDPPAHGIAQVALSGIVPGAKVSTMGHPFGLWYSYSAGHIAAIRIMDLEPMAIYVQTTAPTSKGNSGCGLFNEQGGLVGIAHAGIPMGSNLAFYVHATHVHDFLKGALK